MDKYLIALAYLKELGPVSLKKLLNYFGTAQNIWQASEGQLKALNLTDKLVGELVKQRRLLEPDRIIQELAKEKIKTVSLFEPGYPKLLKEIYTPPLVLFYRGNPAAFNSNYSLAVVGSRKISNYARTIMPELLAKVIKQKVVIVSGLAFGVDALSHHLALMFKGTTLAVIGSGLSRLYPAGNRVLADRIVKSGGLLVSEFAPMVGPLPSNFPRRNRIIAGLVQAVLVVEAADQSGALITAYSSIEQNREVLAVPQNIDLPNSVGVNGLIGRGAKVVTKAEDILETLGLINN